MEPNLKHAADATAAAAAFASFAGWLPVVLSTVASLMSICWLAIQIYEWRQKKKGYRNDF